MQSEAMSGVGAAGGQRGGRVSGFRVKGAKMGRFPLSLFRAAPRRQAVSRPDRARATDGEFSVSAVRSRSRVAQLFLHARARPAVDGHLGIGTAGLVVNYGRRSVFLVKSLSHPD